MVLRANSGGRGEAELKTLLSSVYVPAVFVCVCACVCVCVCVRARVCVCKCARACVRFRASVNVLYMTALVLCLFSLV